MIRPVKYCLGVISGKGDDGRLNQGRAAGQEFIFGCSVLNFVPLAIIPI